MKRATNIDELAKVLMPSKPLTREDEEFYVPLYEEELIEIRDRILHEDIENQTFYIAGQPGVGKTTALNFLVDEEIEAQYEVVRVDISLESSQAPPPFPLLISKIISAISLSYPALDNEILAEIEQHISQSAPTYNNYMSLSPGFIAFINNIVPLFNSLILDYQRNTGKKLLLIIDGTDKIYEYNNNPYSIFYNIGVLENFKCKKVILIPIYLIKLSQLFNRTYININILSPTGFHDLAPKDDRAPSLKDEPFMKIVNKRISSDIKLINTECINRAIQSSGGLIKQFLEILYNAAVAARATQRDNIISPHITKGINKQSEKMRRYLTTDDQRQFIYDLGLKYNKLPFDILIRFLPYAILNNQLIYYIDDTGNTNYFINPIIAPIFNNDKQEEGKRAFNKVTDNFYLNKVTINDFFYIEEIKLDDLAEKKEIYFVGENGDGKTILLQALLMALKGSNDVGELVDFKNGNPHWETCYLQAFDSKDKEFTFTENYRKKNIGQNVFAYGVNRGRSDSEKKDSHGYMTLFDREAYLGSPVRWLQYLDYRQKEEKETNGISLEIAQKMLKEVLIRDIDIEVSSQKVVFSEKGSYVTFEQLSDGYRSILILVCDLIERLSEVQPEVEELSDFKGIVLIDEIELFLHPKWQYEVVQKLRSWFPGIQFILTTHSPTVILGASEDAVFYKVYKENGKTKVVKPLNKIAGWMSNILLTSPLFDMDSARSAATKGPEEVDTSKDYISAKIHEEVRKRIKNHKGVTGQEIIDLVSDLMDKYEEEQQNG